MKKTALIGILTAAVLFLLTCSNNFSILEEIETEVKLSNDKFLVIESVSPDDKAANVNPGMEISIVFDRELDLDSVTDSTLRLYDDTVDSVTDFSKKKYITSTNTLIIEPVTNYFENTHDYTVRVSGVKGEDGSELQEDYIWSFETGTAPAGSIVAVDSDGNAQTGYTSSTNVIVSVLSNNLIAQYYYASNNSDDLSDPGNISDWENIDDDSICGIADTEGIATIYCIFSNSDGSTFSKIETYEINYDTTAPDVDAGEDQIKNTYITQSGSATEAHVYSWAWSGSGLTFTPPNRYYTNISASSDGTYTATLTVTDKAGNTGSDTMMYERDTDPPNPPVVTAATPYPTPTTDTTPYFSWTGDESGDGGSFSVRYYTYSYDDASGFWTYLPGNTTDTSYSPSSVLSATDSDRVRVTLYAWQKDAAGNFSSTSDSGSTLVSNFIPYNTQEDVPVRPTFDWPSYLKGSTYDIQFYSTLLSRWVSIGTEAEGLSSSSFTWHKDLDDLLSGRSYIWRFVTHYGKMTFYGPSLTFTTE